jgi:hypothetical protein
MGNITSTDCSTLKIVSFNVWFDDYMIQERFEILVAELKTHMPDVICFQEGLSSLLLAVDSTMSHYSVTPDFLEWCHASPFFSANYNLSYKAGDKRKVSPYGRLDWLRIYISIVRFSLKVV